MGVAQFIYTTIVHSVNFDDIKGTVSRQSSSFCLILPITRPQSVWNLK